MKKKTDKEKSIKPDWLIEVREWLGAMVPQGKIHEYVKAEFHADAGWEGDPLRHVRFVLLTFYTRAFKYKIKLTEEEIQLVHATARKSHAGSEVYPGTGIVSCGRRTYTHWMYVLNQILAWEMVKIYKEDRQPEGDGL